MLISEDRWGFLREQTDQLIRLAGIAWQVAGLRAAAFLELDVAISHIGTRYPYILGKNLETYLVLDFLSQYHLWMSIV